MPNVVTVPNGMLMNNCSAQVNKNVDIPNNKEVYLTVSQVSEILRLSPTSVRRLESEGKLTSERQSNGYRLFNQIHVLELKNKLDQENIKIKQKEPTSQIYTTTTENLEENNKNTHQEKPQTVYANTTNTNTVLDTPVVTSRNKNFNKISPLSHLSKKIAPEYLLLLLAILVGTISVNSANNLNNKTNKEVKNVKTAYYDTQSNKEIKNNSLIGNVLGVRDRLTNFVYNINLPTNIKNTLNVEGIVSTTEIAFQNIGRITGLQDADTVTENTLERLLDISGDIEGTGLGEVRLAEKVVRPENLSDELAYGGSWDFSGTWSINSTEVTITGDQLNTLGENADTLTSLVDISDTLTTLSESQVSSGGIAFGDGSKYIQDTTNFFWDDTNNRLGIGTNTPQYTVDVNGTLNVSDNTILGGTSVSLTGSNTIFQQTQTGGNLELRTSAEGEIQLIAGANALIALTPSNEKVYIEGYGLTVGEASHLFDVDANLDIVQIGTNAYSNNLLNVGGNIGIQNYLFFGNTSGGVDLDSSYGIRSNGGTLQVKNASGAWSNIATAGGLSPSGTNGAVQFTDGTNFVSDQNNFSWNDVSNYLSINSIRSVGTTNPLLITDHSGVGGITVKSGGFVGVANTNPTYPLDVTGAISTSSELYIAGVGLGSTALSSGATRIGIDYGSLANAPSAANVQEALAALDGVVGASAGDIQSIGSITNGNAFNSIATADGQWLGLGSADGRIAFSTAPGNSQIHFLDARIGIGTTNAGSTLDVNGEIRGTKFAFTNDSNNYFEYLTTDKVGIGTSGLTRFTVDATGRVGIGTTDPDAALTIKPSSSSALNIKNYGSSAGQTGELRFYGIDGSYLGFKAPNSSPSNQIYILPSADGTPDQVLTTDGSGNLTWQTASGVGSSASGDITSVGSMTSGDAFSSSSANGQWLGLGSNAGRLYFADDTTDELSILNANFGIGKTNPTVALDVNGAISSNGVITGTSLTDGTATLTSGSLAGISNITMTGTLDLGANTIADGNLNGNWNFNNGTITSLSSIGTTSLTASGTVTFSGIGSTNTGTNTLVVDGSGRLNYRSIDSRAFGSTLTDGTGISNYIARWLDSNTLGTGTIYDNGTNVGIGNTNNTYKLDVTGDIYSSANIRANTELYKGAIGLGATGTSNTTSGASVIGVFDEFAYSNSLTIQDVLDDFDSQLGSSVGSSLSGTGPQNYLAKYGSSPNILEQSMVYSTSSGVGIGTTGITSALNIRPSTTAGIQLNPTSGASPSQLRFLDADASLYAAFVSPSVLDENTIYTLPTNNGNSNDVLVSDGNGNLSWQSVTGVGAGTGTITAVGNVSSGSAFNSIPTADGKWLGLGASDGRIAFSTAPGNSQIHILDARLGIGTTNASEKVHIIGNMLVSGTSFITTLDLGTNTISDTNFTGTWNFNNGSISGLNSIGTTSITTSGTVTGNSLTDGTATLSSGSITGASNISMSGALDLGTNTISDGNLSGNWNFNGGSASSLSSVGTTSLTASGNVTFSGIGSTNTGNNIAVIDGSGKLNYRSIDSRVWDNSLADGTGVSNYISRWLDSNTLGIGAIYDNGTNIGIGKTNPTAKLDVLGAITSSSTITGTSLTDGTATLSSGSITGASNITMSGTFDLGTNTIADGNLNGNWNFNSGSASSLASIGTTSLTASGTVIFSGIGSTSTGNNTITIGDTGLLKYRTLDTRIWDNTLTDGSGISNYLTKWLDSNTIQEGLIYDNGSFIGIGTTASSSKLEVEVASTGNRIALVLDQKDTTNNPRVLQIENSGTGDAIYIDSGEFIVDSTGNLTTTGTTGITLASNADLIFGTIGIRDTGSNVTTSGASLIGFYGIGNTYATGDDVQEVINQLDTQLQSVIDGNITGVGSISTGDVFANATADNQWLGLGSTAGRIYFDDLSTDKISILDAYLGIGTSSPLNTVDILGNAVIGSSYAGTNTAPSNGLLVQGSFGLGTVSPLNKLDVSGSAVIGSSYAGTVTAPSNGLLVQGALGIGTSSVTTGMGLYVDRGIGLTAGEYLNIGTTYGSTGYGLREYNGSIQVKNLGGNWVDLVGGGYFDLYGNSAPTATVALDQSYAYRFGIGTTAASEALHVVGNALITGNIDLGTNTISDGNLSGNWNFGSGNITSNGILTLTGIASTDSGSNVLIVDGSGTVKYKSFTSVSGTGASNYLTRWLTSNTIGTGSIYDNGTNVGIGTTNMSYKLNIAGTSLHQSDAYFGNSTSYYVNASGNAKFQGLTLDETGTFGLSIGNGTTGSMKVGSASIKDDGTSYLSFDTTNNSADEFRIYDSGDLWSRTGSLISDIITSSTAVAFELDTTNSISTAGAKLLSLRTANVEKMYVDKDGYVGTPMLKNAGTSPVTLISLETTPYQQTLDFMEYTNDTNAQSAYVSNGLTAATGGTVSYTGDYTVHTFTNVGTTSFVASTSISNLEYLVVAGGGAGGSSGGRGGGGGGGGVLTGTMSVSGSNTVTVGAGGSVVANNAGNNGGNSIFSSVTAIGGGGGAGANYPTEYPAKSGGSGGGGEAVDTFAGYQNNYIGANGTVGQGYAGGNGWYDGQYRSGGGGGAGGVGQSGQVYSQPEGGVGVQSSISGVATYYGGGGGGGVYWSGGPAAGGTGGNGGGGAGQGVSTGAVAGTANTGGGGGGNAAAGGSGIVIVRYTTPLKVYSENSTKTQGSYAIKGVAQSVTSVNKTLTKTIGSPINLSNYEVVYFDIRSNRTGSNIKVGIRDSGGTVTEITPSITASNIYQTVSLDLSGVSNANKDAIDQIIVTIVNADSTNTFYIDNMYASFSYSDITFSTNNIERMRLSSLGNIGIGMTNPTYKLQVNGQPAANGYTTFTNYSDYRLKENINPLQDSYMSKLMMLNPVTYNYNELTGYDEQTRNRLMTGFVAQELKEVFPEMVGTVTINGTDYYDTNLSNLQLYLLKGIQEQQQQINDIKNTLSSLNVEGLVGTNVQVNNDINVLGASTLNDVTITGDLNIGQINIDSLNNTIQVNGPNCTSSETLCNEQTLYVQKNLAGNLDIFDGNMLLETDGSITIKGTLKAEEITSKSYNVNMSGNTIGSGTIATGEKSVLIETSNVKGTSKIFITAPNMLGKAVNMSVTEKVPGQRFKVEIPETLNEDITFDWWIINITE